MTRRSCIPKTTECGLGSHSEPVDASELIDMGGPLPRLAVDLKTTKEAASYVGLSPNTLAWYRAFGGGPGYWKRGRRVYYAMQDLDEWLYDRRIQQWARS